MNKAILEVSMLKARTSPIADPRFFIYYIKLS